MPLGGFPEKGDLDPKVVGVDDLGKCVIERIYFKSEFDVLIPAFLAKPKGTEPCIATIYVCPDGKEDAAYRLLGESLRETAVFGIDVRGVGETKGDERQSILSGMSLGRPIFAMRVWDIIRSADYLLSRGDITSVRVAGFGSPTCGLPALYAAALDERIESATAEQLLLSYKEGDLTGLDSAFIPGILRHADVCDIASLIAPRRLVVRSPVTGSGSNASLKEAEKTFAPARHIYNLLDADGNFVIEYGRG